MRRSSIEYPARPFGSILAATGNLSLWTSLGRHQHDMPGTAWQLVYP
jgi:hypothetical protein